MIPDEVVKVLEIINGSGKLKRSPEVNLIPDEHQALQSAISLLQDYQELRERVSVEKISQVTIDLVEDNFPKGKCKERGKAIVLHAQMLIAIVTYLQQPTEHIGRDRDARI